MTTENQADTYALFEQSRKAANERNITQVFDALQQAGITSVVVGFDGEGDDGLITETTVEPVDKALPQLSITVFGAQYRTDELLQQEMPLSEAIEEVCYLLLDQDNDGWENNYGAMGEFMFDVADKTVELEFNARFTDFNTSNYSYGAKAVAEETGSSPADTVRGELSPPGATPSIEPSS